MGLSGEFQISNPIRIALIAEGPTDRIFLKAAIGAILGRREFVLHQLQPEESLPFGAAKTGWGGVYKWCRNAAERNTGTLESDPLFLGHDLLVIQIDTDVALKRYTDYQIKSDVEDIPFAIECPPPENASNKLKRVLLRWLGVGGFPASVIPCIPSRNMETWVTVALFPDDATVASSDYECFADPESRMRAQKIKFRIRKSEVDYESNASKFRTNWLNVSVKMKQAKSFETEFSNAAAGVLPS